jgi:hypothetical protein
MTISSIAGIIAQILVSTSHLYFSLPYMFMNQAEIKPVHQSRTVMMIGW